MPEAGFISFAQYAKDQGLTNAETIRAYQKFLSPRRQQPEVGRGKTDPNLLTRFGLSALASATSPLELIGLGFKPEMSAPDTVPEKVAQTLGGITGMVVGLGKIGAAVGGVRFGVKAATKGIPAAMGLLGSSKKYVGLVKSIAEISPRLANMFNSGINNIIAFGTYEALSRPRPSSIVERMETFAEAIPAALLFTAGGALSDLGKAGKVMQPFTLMGMGMGSDFGKIDMPMEDRIIGGLSFLAFHYAKAGFSKLAIRDKQLKGALSMGYSPEEALEIVGSAKKMNDDIYALVKKGKTPRFAQTFIEKENPDNSVKLLNYGKSSAGRWEVTFEDLTAPQKGNIRVHDKVFFDKYTPVLEGPSGRNVPTASGKMRGFLKGLYRSSEMTEAEQKAFNAGVTGKESTTDMSQRELRSLIAAMSGPPERSVFEKLHPDDVNADIRNRATPKAKKRYGALSSLMDRVGRLTLPAASVIELIPGPAAKVAATKARQFSLDRIEFVGKWQDSFACIRKESGFSGKEIVGAIGAIEGEGSKFWDYVPGSLVEKISKGDPGVAKFKEIHQRYVDFVYSELKKHSAVVKVYRKGKFVSEPIEKHHVKNFVRHQFSDQARDYFEHSERFIRRTIENIMNTNKGMTEDDAYQLLSDTLRWQDSRLPGRLYARVADLDPAYAWDAKGNPIKLKNFNIKKGDVVIDADGKQVKAAEVVQTYETNYEKAMLSYVVRAAHYVPSIKHWGNDPEGGIENITLKIGAQSDPDRARFAKKVLKDQVLGSDYDRFTATAIGNVVNISASLGLSSPFSGIKNLFLGQVQNITTFGVRQSMEGFYRLASNPKQFMELSRRIGAFEAGARLIETALGKKGPGVKARIGGFARLWMEKTELANRITAVAIGDTYFGNALSLLQGKMTPLRAGMSKEQAIRAIEKIAGLDPLEVIKRGYTPEEQVKIWQVSHANTQGLPDAPFIPGWMSGRYGKAATLFYRIAYRITENIYDNVFMPAVETGNMLPMMRFVAASGIAGGTLLKLYHLALDKERNDFQDLPNKFWDEFIRAEGLGIFSNAFDEFGGFVQSYTPAILRPINAVASNVAALLGQTKTLEQSLRDSLKEAIVIYGHSYEFRESYAEPIYKEYKNLKRKQRFFEESYIKTRADQEFAPSSPNDKTPYYRTIRDSFYTTEDLNKRGRSYWATVNYLAHQIFLENGGRFTIAGAKRQAKARVAGIITDMQPISLSRERARGERMSRHQQFVRALSPEDKLRVREMEKVYRRKRAEYYKSIRITKPKYGWQI